MGAEECQQLSDTSNQVQMAASPTAGSNARMKFPNFLIIGAQKCGTTWLSNMLRQHPEVGASTKNELQFFNYNYHLGMSWYLNQFPDQHGKTAVGEFTPNYFWTSDRATGESPPDSHFRVPERVAATYPDMKLVVLLREPVSRAVSAYYHHIRDRTLSPFASLYGSRFHRGILSMGFYDVHLGNWLKHFPREQLHVLFFEEAVIRDKTAALNGVCNFLQIDPDFAFDNPGASANQRSSHLYMMLNYYMPRFTKNYYWRLQPLERFGWPRIGVSTSDLDAMREIYAPHNQRLTEMLSRSLPWPT
jgi:hypothetical protein